MFLLTNLSDLPISAFIVGEGKIYDYRFMLFDSNTPTKMEAPAGWDASALPGERSYYLWMVKDFDKEKMIQPGKSVSDFRIYLPEDTRKVPIFAPNGAQAIQEKFKDLPFKVNLSDSSCLWGVIKIVDYID